MMRTPSISTRVTILMVAIVLAAPIITNILLAMVQKA
jgi:hypothetical protein